MQHKGLFLRSPGQQCLPVACDFCSPPPPPSPSKAFVPCLPELLIPQSISFQNLSYFVIFSLLYLGLGFLKENFFLKCFWRTHPEYLFQGKWWSCFRFQMASSLGFMLASVTIFSSYTVKDRRKFSPKQIDRVQTLVKIRFFHSMY